MFFFLGDLYSRVYSHADSSSGFLLSSARSVDLPHRFALVSLELGEHPAMQMPRNCMLFICLWGTVLSGQGQNFLQDMDMHLETSSESLELETASSHLPGVDTRVTHVSGSAVPAGKFLLLSFNCFLFLSA